MLLHTRERNSFSISPQTQSLQLPLIASAQDEAVAAGAVYGFGKAELGSREVVERLAAILGSDAPT